MSDGDGKSSYTKYDGAGGRMRDAEKVRVTCNWAYGPYALCVLGLAHQGTNASILTGMTVRAAKTSA